MSAWIIPPSAADNNGPTWSPSCWNSPQVVVYRGSPTTNALWYNQPEPYDEFVAAGSSVSAAPPPARLDRRASDHVGARHGFSQAPRRSGYRGCRGR